jgi:hypothetical protein
MKNVVFLDIKTQFVLQRRHITSTLQSSAQLMLYKIWGFHGGDYEECRLLGYKTPVRISQEKHYVSATESNRLMLCKNWGFHGSDYEECHLVDWHRVALVRTDVTTLMVVVMRSSESSVPTRATQRHIPEDGVLQSILRHEFRADIPNNMEAIVRMCKGTCWFRLVSLSWDVELLPIRNGVFWDVTPCGSCKNRHFEGT